MLSEVLSSFAEITRVIAEEEEYLLARVESRGGRYVAEVVPAGGRRAPSWPDLKGLLAPLASKTIRGVHIRVFDVGGSDILAERLSRGPMGEREALQLALDLVPVLGELASANRIPGYLGPECVVCGDDGPQILGGGRGSPKGPFTAPEAQGGVAGDPRSMVFALGTLVFRCIAGTDDKQRQIAAWRTLSDSTRSLLERAVGERPEERLPSVTIFGREIRRALDMDEEPPARQATEESSPEEPEEGDDDGTPPAASTSATAPQGFARKHGYRSTAARSRRSLPVYLAVFVVIAAAVVAVILLVPDLLPGGGGDAPPPPDTSSARTVADSVAVDTALAAGPAPADSSTASPADSARPVAAPSVIWVSNRAPEPGAELDYRTGVLSGYSHVFPFSGGRPREGSLLLLRRDDPSTGMEGQGSADDARAIMRLDSTLESELVDLTVMVGADLRYDGINEGILTQPSDPAGTLYVEVVNQGMEFPPDGQTPAHLWLARVVDRRSVTVPGQGEWLLQIVQARWGDRGSNEEVPLEYGLDSTVFLYRRGSAHCRAAEAAIREAIQPIPRAVAGPPEGLVIPDIWILVGGPEEGQSP
jgi:hypothetical protein